MQRARYSVIPIRFKIDIMTEKRMINPPISNKVLMSPDGVPEKLADGTTVFFPGLDQCSKRLLKIFFATFLVSAIRPEILVPRDL